MTLAYIGPGTGFVFLGSFLATVLSFVATFVSLLIWPFRMLWLVLRSNSRFRRAQVKKVIVLGLDGLDPRLTEQFMAEGKMPHFAKLRDSGCYSRLRTTFPALSPVAWSTFATGVNPAKHNIFDFLNRDLRTYLPQLSTARVTPAPRVLKIGKVTIPLSRPQVESRRKSEAFWTILGRHAVPSTVLRVPVSFPPEKFYGRQLSAMSTPDLRGSQGTFSWFATETDGTSVEGGNRCLLTRNGRGSTGELVGPDSDAPEVRGPFTVPFQIRLRDANRAVLGITGREYELVQGEYSPWIRLRFGKGLSSAAGIARFLLTASEPISLYVTPVQIDPERPALPISHPAFYAGYLAKLLGTYSTLGMAEDTWALNEGAIDEDTFLKQAYLIQQEREGMFFSALEHGRKGVVACVFDHTDRIQHMFYRYLRTEAGERQHEGAQVIERLYADCDRLLAETWEYVDEGTALFVLSDHGFSAFRWGVNINSWLLREGYLALKDGAEASGPYFENVDWARTRAYTFGLSGFYLNVRGRERHGIVPPENTGDLKRELIGKLTGLLNDFGEIAIRDVYAATDIYRGPYRDMAPDLIVGYADGHRASWGAAVRRVTEHVFEENHKAWSGDHCVDPSLVPGVLFSNLKFKPKDPGIEDLAPTFLKLFGIARPEWMEGEPLVAAP